MRLDFARGTVAAVAPPAGVACRSCSTNEYVCTPVLVVTGLPLS